MGISDNIERVRGEVRHACADAGRDPDEVRLLAVSKTRGVEEVRAAVATGQTDLGENYLQEAIQKVNAVPDACWHFIGAIQSNKTRDIARCFTWVHSVASLKVARRLSEQRDTGYGPLNLLIQVNVSGEEAKSGVMPDLAKALVADAQAFEGIRLRGLMTIPEAGLDTQASRQRFRLLRELRDDISASLGLEEFDQLSMGMSADFPLAIREGATWIRIGTAIFGPRTNLPEQSGGPANQV